MVGRPLLVALVIGTLAIGARDGDAESDTLVEARKAIAAVRYHEAQPLLVATLQAGDNPPAQLIEIYRLSASTAIVLGEQDVAEQYYRRWLALVPTAKLPDGVAPKLREPFVAAQAYMAAHGRLSVKAQRRTAPGHTVDVIVESDPLAMVASVAIDAGGPLVSKPVGADHLVQLEVAPDATVRAVVVLDEFRNHLLDVPAAEISVAVGALQPGVTSTTSVTASPKPATPPLLQNPIAWSVPALAFAAAGIGFGLAAGRAQQDVDGIVAHPGQSFFTDLQDAQQRRDRDALFANLGFAVGGACAVTAVVMYLVRPDAAVSVAPTGGGGAVVVMSRPW